MCEGQIPRKKNPEAITRKISRSITAIPAPSWGGAREMPCRGPFRNLNMDIRVRRLCAIVR